MPPCGTFCYRGVVPLDWPYIRTWPVRDESGADRVSATDRLRGERLVGLNPVVEVGTESIKLRARSQERAQARTATLPFAEAFAAILVPDDELWLVRTDTADLALSLVRADDLVFAVGAVSQIAVGSRLRIGGGGEPTNLIVESLVAGGPWPSRDTWLDLELGNQSVRLRTGESARLDAYEAFVLTAYEDCLPGKFEIAAVTNGELLTSAAATEFLPKLRDWNLYRTIQHWSWLQRLWRW